MARGIAKRKYKKIRKEFKHEIEEELKKNRALGMALLITYIADKHRKYIHRMWGFFGRNYKDAWNHYCESGLHGKMLCGYESLYRTLYFSGYEEISKKYRRKLPEKIAYGEIYSLVMKCVNGEL